MSCVMAGFMMSGKSEDETMAFLKESDEAKAGVRVSFDAPDGGALRRLDLSRSQVRDRVLIIA